MAAEEIGGSPTLLSVTAESGEKESRNQDGVRVRASFRGLPSVSAEQEAETPEEPPRRPIWRRVEVLVATAGVLALAAVTLVLYDVVGVPAAPSAGPSSSVTTVPTTAETSSSGPSATSATSGPQPTSTTGPRPSTSQPPVTTTTQTSDGPKPPAEDPGRYEGVQEQRVVKLVPQTGGNWVDIEYWRQDPAQPGEVQMDAKGVHTAVGAALAVIADTPLANRDRCSKVTTWRLRVDFSELHVGSQLCGRSSVGRYASLEVQVLPSSPSSGGRFFFYGITWN